MFGRLIMHNAKKELPDLTKLANDYNGKAGFLGVIHNIEPLTSTSSDYDKKTREENIARAKSLLEKADAKYQNLCPSQAAEKYFNFKIKAVPTVFIFDSEGNILETFIGVGAHGFYEKYERALKKYIK